MAWRADGASQLEVRFPTESLVNQAIVARDDVPPALVQRVGRLLAEMHDTERGRALMAVYDQRLCTLVQTGELKAIFERWKQPYPF